MTQDVNDRLAIAQFISRVQQDPAFKERVMRDPKASLAEAGLTVPAGKQVRIVENSETVTYLPLSEQSVLDANPDAWRAGLAGMLPLAAGTELRLVQNSAEEIVVVIPVAAKEPDVLSDEQLDAVSGGAGWQDNTQNASNQQFMIFTPYPPPSPPPRQHNIFN